MSLFNPAEGVRKAMRKAYDNHHRAAVANNIQPHATALVGALMARYKHSGRLFAEIVHWTEITPFACMSPQDGREALAEYIVCQERPQDGRLDWLKKMINSALHRPSGSEEARDARSLASETLYFPSNIPWLKWLDEEVGKQLMKEFADQDDQD